ncbi:hypothetical protein [Rhodococcus sp. NPDC127528]|uniref:hypothetical protein n=1 Tax=unclassified Rhodococcus (in: high G+C Gram-positive bacteria) TaxID=192944 RepID=UPI003641187A
MDPIQYSLFGAERRRPFFDLIGQIGAVGPRRVVDLGCGLVSNALLQWVPTHRELLVEWAGELELGGWIAFQVPANFGSSPPGG